MKTPRLNAAWHLLNKMPEKATLDQRIEWHLEHVKNCACRSIPEKLLSEIEKRKLSKRK